MFADVSDAGFEFWSMLGRACLGICATFGFWFWVRGFWRKFQGKTLEPGQHLLRASLPETKEPRV